MCFPGAPVVAMMGIQAAQGIAGFEGQQQQYGAEETRFNQNYQNALAQNRIDETTLGERQMQEDAAYAQKDRMAAIEGATKSAQIAVSAAASGVAGPTVTSLVNSVGEQINTKRADLETNWQNTVQDIQSQKTSAVSQEVTRMGEVANPVSPSPVGSMLGVAGNVTQDLSSPSGAALGNTINQAVAGLNVTPM